MSNYIKVTNGIPEIYSLANLRSDYPNVSKLPRPPKTPQGDYDAWLSTLGIYPVTVASKPTLQDTEEAVLNDLPELVDGKWVLGWTVTTKGREQIKKQVNQERDRRIAAGFTWNGNTYQSDADSLSNIAGAATSAVAFMVAGGSSTEVYWADPSQPFVWLTVDNTEVQMTPQDVVAFGNTAMAHKKNHIYAARTLKDMNPIPQDFTKEQYWP